jgi:hypothetical protein
MTQKDRMWRTQPFAGKAENDADRVCVLQSTKAGTRQDSLPPLFLAYPRGQVVGCLHIVEHAVRNVKAPAMQLETELGERLKAKGYREVGRGRTE